MSHVPDVQRPQNTPRYVFFLVLLLAGLIAVGGYLGHRDISARQSVERVIVNTAKKPF